MSSFPFQFQSKKFRAVSAVKWPKSLQFFDSPIVFSHNEWTAAAALDHYESSQLQQQQQHTIPGCSCSLVLVLTQIMRKGKIMTILVENPMVGEERDPKLTAARHTNSLYNTIACAFIPFFGVATILRAAIVRPRSGIIDCKNASNKVSENHMKNVPFFDLYDDQYLNIKGNVIERNTSLGLRRTA